jgi:hypothetical protein
MVVPVKETAKAARFPFLFFLRNLKPITENPLSYRTAAITLILWSLSALMSVVAVGAGITSIIMSDAPERLWWGLPLNTALLAIDVVMATWAATGWARARERRAAELRAAADDAAFEEIVKGMP